MTATLDDVLAGLQTRLQTIDTLAQSTTTYVPTALSRVPAAYAFLDDNDAGGVEYDVAFGGLDLFHMTVVVVTGLEQDYQRAQSALWEYMRKTGTRSVKRALEADTTLGSVANNLTVHRVTIGKLAIGDKAYLGALWVVSVWA